MSGDLRASLGVSLAFAAVFGLAELWKRKWRGDPEWTRKAVHLGCGLIVCAFPWIFESPRSVAALSALFFLLLLGARWKKLLPSVQGVARQSWGELLFPVSTGALALLAWGRKDLFVAPMLTLAVADALAALVGRAHGSRTYVVDQGQRKSLQGSLAFFAAAFATILLPLLLWGPQPALTACLVALQVAWLVTGFEAISLSGLDNLILPLGGWYLLVQLTQADASWMALQLSAQAGLSLLALALAWRYPFLSASGLVAAQLYIYAAFAYGGPAWSAGPLAGMAALAFLFQRWRPKDPRRAQVLAVYHSVLAPLAVLLFNNFSVVFPTPLQRPGLWPWLAPLHAGLLTSSLAIAAWIGGTRPGWRIAIPASACALLATLAQGFSPASLNFLIGAALLHLALYYALGGAWPPRSDLGAFRRLSATGLAAAAALLCLI